MQTKSALTSAQIQNTRDIKDIKHQNAKIMHIKTVNYGYNAFTKNVRLTNDIKLFRHGCNSAG